MEDNLGYNSVIEYICSDDDEEDSFMSCVSSMDTKCIANDSITYIQLIFDPDRGGFVDVAENIVQYLDYHSLINLKRSSTKIYNFFKQLPSIEDEKLEKKLDLDWRLGQPKNYTIQTPGLVSCASVFPDNRRMVIGIDHVVHVVDIRSGEPLHILKHDESNNEFSSPITCVSYLEGFNAIASGSCNGDLSIWELEGEEVSAHFGCAYDIGCVTIRQFNSSLKEPTVIFSLYQDIYPVFCIDICDNYLSTVEWSGTFNQVHTGNVNVYKWLESEPLANLTESSNTTFTCCRFIRNNRLLTGGQDGKIRIWKIKNDRVYCQREYLGHKSIIMRMEIGWNCDRAVTRDINGLISIWDLVEACNIIKNNNNSIIQNYHHQNNDEKLDNLEIDKYLVRKVTSTSKTVTCIALDDRQLVMGSIGHLNVFDYWNSATVD